MAIAYNSTSILNEVAAGATSTTWSHTCNASDKKLVVAEGGRYISNGCTYNGTAMTSVNTETSNYQKSQVWYLDDPHTGGAANIVVSYGSSSTYRMAVACGISGCEDGIGNTSKMAFITSNDPQDLYLTTGTANSDVLYSFWRNNKGATISNVTGEIVKNTENAGCYYMAYDNTTTAGSYYGTIQQTDSGNNQAGIAVEIKIGATPSGPAKLKTWNGTLKAKIKSINGTLIAKVKSYNSIV